MQIQRIIVENFRSFKHEQVLEFGDRPGLYHLTGTNKLERQLGANGAGKSTIWEALIWCFYGKTSRGLRGPSVINWEAGSACMVTVDFMLKDKQYSLTRVQNPNSLILSHDGKDEPQKQEQVEDLLGLQFTEFLSSIVFGQFKTFFFDLTPAEKLRVFSESMRLDAWLEASDRAAAASKEHEKIVSDFKLKVVEVSGRLSTAESDLDRMEKAQADFETAREASIQSFLSEAETFDSEASAARVKLEEVRRVETTKKDPEPLERELLSLSKEVKDLREKRGALHMESAAIDAKLGEQNSQREKIQKSIETGVCSMCGRKPDARHIELELAKVNSARSDLEQAFSRLKNQITPLDTSISEKESRMLEVDRALSEIRAQVRTNAEPIRRLEHEINVKTTQAKVKRELAEAKKKEPNFTSMAVESKKAQIEKDLSILEVAREKLAAAEVELDRVAFWKKGFKDLRLWLINTSLTQLEVEVNNALAQLGMTGWVIKFDVEKENTSGGISKGFHVLVTSPGSENAIAWESWSGGETQRLKIAGEIGLANLIRAHSGVSANIEVWDEPTAHLSVEGVDDLLRFFDERARSSGVQVWLVDHRSLDYGGFAGQVVVEKDHRGSLLASVLPQRDHAKSE